MNVIDVTATVLATKPEAILVSSLGTATSSVRLSSNDGPHFYFGAAMGSALPGALGLAEAAVDRQVVAILGDGDFLMGANSLWSVAAYHPANLTVVVLADRSYSITGGQPIPGTLALAEVANSLPGLVGARVADTASLAAALTTDTTGVSVIEASISEKLWPGPSPFVDPAETVRALRATLGVTP